ncbi:Sugar phosphate isomerase/epimerase [Cognatiyoonia sediminum]|uniref:Sugar phosphate isomerase/epimerase n=1 Tax=Cognatiyoonia sediminum TaxID=1508389 RepID=A0A1M5RGB2_9RHOB|nr:sugar phosphate isomerase/epimerase [Cognatiyoonia sediminum]SHH25392.1 Sugar phosphate isomerase/epimerase [Cognatiyoonia sediminum]
MPHIAYQLYCSRNFPPLAETCKMLSEAGYSNVEGFGGLFGDLPTLEAALKDNGLRMTSSHIGLDMLENDPAKILEIASTFGTQKMFVPFVMPDDRPNDDAGWRAFGKRLEAAGKPVKDAGVAFGWHNHDFEFVATESGAMPMDLIAEADIDLELDLGWVARAGLDPVEWINKYAGRIKAVHVKDIAPTGEATDEDGWADVGHGTLDWGSIHAALHHAGIDRYVVEHDNPSDDKRFATRSITSINAF